jgi:hypothetical protein
MHGDDKSEDFDAQTEPQVPLDKDSIERLGRERPALFPNRWVELSFCFSLLASELLAVRYPPLPSVLSLMTTGILR